MKLLRAHFMGKPIIRAHFMGREIRFENGDLYAASDSHIYLKGDADLLNTATVLAKSNTAAAAGDTVEAKNTAAIVSTKVRDAAAGGSRTTLTATRTLLGETRDGAGIGQRLSPIKYTFRVGNVNTGVVIIDNAEVITAANPRFTEAKEDIVSGHSAEGLTMSGIKHSSAAAGLSLGERAEAQKYSYVTASAKSGVGIIQAAEASVDVGTTVKSGWYTTQDDISPVETFKIALPIFFIYSVSGTWPEFLASHVENANISGLGYRLSLNVPNSGGSTNRIVASVGYTNGVPYWKFNTYLQKSKFMVTQDTQLSKENFEIFSRNFKLIGT